MILLPSSLLSSSVRLSWSAIVILYRRWRNCFLGDDAPCAYHLHVSTLQLRTTVQYMWIPTSTNNTYTMKACSNYRVNKVKLCEAFVKDSILLHSGRSGRSEKLRACYACVSRPQVTSLVTHPASEIVQTYAANRWVLRGSSLMQCILKREKSTSIFHYTIQYSLLF